MQTNRLLLRGVAPQTALVAALAALAMLAGASRLASADEAAVEAPAARSLLSTPSGETARPRPLVGSDAEPAGAFLGEILPTAGALGATLLVIVLARSGARRLGLGAPGARGPSGVVQVLARYPVARGQQVVLLEVGRRILVTHQTAQAVTTLSEFTDADDVADLRARCEAGRRGTRDFSFDAILRRSSREFDRAESARGAVARAPEAAVGRHDVRSVLPEALRSAEIETVDLTRQGASARGARR
jgi:flagellar biogenesis protein FliO